MKYTILKCDCCGETFYTEYWQDGYIDHYINFASNHDTLVKKGVDEIAYQITMDGNDFRGERSIGLRLACFKKYCEMKNLCSLYEEVESEVTKQIEHLRKLDEIRIKIGKLVEGMTDREKEYIGLQYQEY